MARRTVTVEVTQFDVFNMKYGAKIHLDHIVKEYDGQEAYRYLIDEAKADVAKW